MPIEGSTQAKASNNNPNMNYHPQSTKGLKVNQVFSSFFIPAIAEINPISSIK